jgi:YVTN family beta-propeller protein
VLPAIAITPDGGIAYVADPEGNTVTPIRTATNTALRPIKVRRQPGSLAVTPDGRTVYAVNDVSDEGPLTVTPVRNCVSA